MNSIILIHILYYRIINNNKFDKSLFIIIANEELIEMLKEQLRIQDNHKKQFDVLMALLQQNALNNITYDHNSTVFRILNFKPFDPNVDL